MAMIHSIETLAKSYSFARQQLASKVQEMKDELSAIEKRFIPGIKRLINIAKTYKSDLHNAIDISPELFIKPKTRVLHGIKVGFMKGKGELKIEAPDHTIKLLKKSMPEKDWEKYIKTTETLIKTTLSQLPASELKRLGIEVIETGDYVVIKPTDSEVDKLVEALLKDEVKEAKEAA